MTRDELREKVRVLFLLSDLEAGGAQRVILTVIRHLDRNRIEPHLGLVKDNGPMLKEIPAYVPVHDLGARRVRYALPGILRLCHSLRPEGLLSTLGHLNLAVLALKPLLPRSIRICVREANTPSIRLRYTMHPHLYRSLYRFLYPLADALVCNSVYMKQDMERYLSMGPERMVVIGNPVDSERINSLWKSENNPYRDGRFQMVAVGRLHFQKGFDLLLKTFRRSLIQMPDLRLTIVGDGPEKARLQEFATELGIADSVYFAGHRDNPYPYMVHADLFVSSSRWEGSPNAVLEALACGTPVLSFDCPGGTGEILEEGKNGWLVPHGDWVAMAERIVEIAGGKRVTEREKGGFLPEKHECGHVARKYEDVLLRPTRIVSGQER